MGEFKVLDNTLDRTDRENVGQTEQLEHIGRTYFKSSSRAVQNRHAQYTLIVNDIALVMQRPAVPAETYPESANNVVINTARPPSVSKLSNSHRFVIQKLYHICIHALTSCRDEPRNTGLCRHVDLTVQIIQKSTLRRECANGHNTI